MKDIKLRLIKNSKDYIIQIYEREHILFGKKVWKDSHIYDFNKENGEFKCDGLKEYHPLKFKNIDDANYVYDSILSNKFLTRECQRIIFGLDRIPKEIEVIREN